MIENIALTFEAIGTLLIAWAALSVHHRVLNEHKIDAKVFRTMSVEQKLGGLGILMITIAYLLNVLY
jgi:hypothetical protein